MPISGINQVNNKIRKSVSVIAGSKSHVALTRIGIIGQGHAMRMTPVDTSNLINSQFRVITKTANGFKMTIGYTANYASYVHEKPENFSAAGPVKTVTFKKAAAEKEFLKKGFERDGFAQIQKELRKTYKV